MSEAAGRTGAPSRHDPAGLDDARRAQFPSADRSGLASRTARNQPEPAIPQRSAACSRTPRQRPRHMIRPLTIATCLLACGSGLYLYQSKHEVQLLDRTIERTVHDTGALREQSRLLAAEWTMLNDPERLRQFSDTYLSLKTIAPPQFTSLADLDSRLPAPLPEAPSHGTDEQDPAAVVAETAPRERARSSAPPPTPRSPRTTSCRFPPFPPPPSAPAVASAARPADTRTRGSRASAPAVRWPPTVRPIRSRSPMPALCRPASHHDQRPYDQRRVRTAPLRTASVRAARRTTHRGRSR